MNYTLVCQDMPRRVPTRFWRQVATSRDKYSLFNVRCRWVLQCCFWSRRYHLSIVHLQNEVQTNTLDKWSGFNYYLPMSPWRFHFTNYKKQSSISIYIYTAATNEEQFRRVWWWMTDWCKGYTSKIETTTNTHLVTCVTNRHKPSHSWGKNTS